MRRRALLRGGAVTGVSALGGGAGVASGRGSAGSAAGSTLRVRVTDIDDQPAEGLGVRLLHHNRRLGRVEPVTTPDGAVVRGRPVSEDGTYARYELRFERPIRELQEAYPNELTLVAESFSAPPGTVALPADRRSGRFWFASRKFEGGALFDPTEEPALRLTSQVIRTFGPEDVDDDRYDSGGEFRVWRSVDPEDKRRQEFYLEAVGSKSIAYDGPDGAVRPGSLGLVVDEGMEVDYDRLGIRWSGEVARTYEGNRTEYQFDMPALDESVISPRSGLELPGWEYSEPPSEPTPDGDVASALVDTASFLIGLIPVVGDAVTAVGVAGSWAKAAEGDDVPTVTLGEGSSVDNNTQDVPTAGWVRPAHSAVLRVPVTFDSGGTRTFAARGSYLASRVPRTMRTDDPTRVVPQFEFEAGPNPSLRGSDDSEAGSSGPEPSRYADLDRETYEFSVTPGLPCTVRPLEASAYSVEEWTDGGWRLLESANPPDAESPPSGATIRDALQSANGVTVTPNSERLRVRSPANESFWVQTYSPNQVWPRRADVDGDTCRVPNGGTAPATGEGATPVFGGPCGRWKEYAVVPGEEYAVVSTVDGCRDCVLYDAAYTVAEPPGSRGGEAPTTVEGSDWVAVDRVTDPKGRSFDGQYHQLTVTPRADRIRLYNADGNGGIGFYGEVYGPPVEGE